MGLERGSIFEIIYVNEKEKRAQKVLLRNAYTNKRNAHRRGYCCFTVAGGCFSAVGAAINAHCRCGKQSGRVVRRNEWFLRLLRLSRKFSTLPLCRSKDWWAAELLKRFLLGEWHISVALLC